MTVAFLIFKVSCKFISIHWAGLIKHRILHRYLELVTHDGMWWFFSGCGKLPHLALVCFILPVFSISPGNCSLPCRVAKLSPDPHFGLVDSQCGNRQNWIERAATLESKCGNSVSFNSEEGIPLTSKNHSILCGNVYHSKESEHPGQALNCMGQVSNSDTCMGKEAITAVTIWYHLLYRLCKDLDYANSKGEHPKGGRHTHHIFC